jgi:hypothetical protein
MTMLISLLELLGYIIIFIPYGLFDLFELSAESFDLIEAFGQARDLFFLFRDLLLRGIVFLCQLLHDLLCNDCSALVFVFDCSNIHVFS